ncbi:coilin-like [Argopecten irradians]|uniref:coilin-like n=1 Tax=Argopecten irradians TaxID=31199 RepID=UPI003712513D
MSATMEKHVRIRLYFDNSSVAPTWFLVDHESFYTIRDLENEIRCRYLENNIPITLSLDDCVLPKSEKTLILRDNDRVVVRECGNHNIPSDLNFPVVNEKWELSYNVNNFVGKKENKANTQSKTKKKTKQLQCQGPKKKSKKQKRVVSPDFLQKSEELQHETKKSKKKRKLVPSPDFLQKSEELQHETKKTKKKRKLDKKEKSPEIQQRKRSRDFSCSELNSVSQKTLIDTNIKDTDVTNSMPPESEKDKESITPLTGNDIENVGVVDESGFEEQGTKKRRRRRKRLLNKKSDEGVASGSGNQNRNTYDNKQHKQPYSKPARNTIHVYGTKNNHKIFNDSDPEGETHGTQENVIEMEETNTGVQGKEDSLEQAKKKLLEKVEQEYLSLTDHSDTGSRHVSADRTFSGNVEAEIPSVNKGIDRNFRNQNSNQHPNEYHQNLSDTTGKPVNEIGQNTKQEDQHDSCGLSGIQLQLTKLASGAPVYTRQRQKRYFNASYGKELTKEQQLGTKLVNKSVVIRNDQPTTEQGPDQTTSERQADLFVPCPVQDYTKFPPLQGTPREGDKIAYKVLELSDSYTPEISRYKEGVVLSFNHTTHVVEIEAKSAGQDSGPQGKFHMNADNENTESEPKFLLWNSLMETRLLDIV